MHAKIIVKFLQEDTAGALHKQAAIMHCETQLAAGWNCRGMSLENFPGGEAVEGNCPWKVLGCSCFVQG